MNYDPYSILKILHNGLFKKTNILYILQIFRDITLDIESNCTNESHSSFMLCKTCMTSFLDIKVDFYIKLGVINIKSHYERDKMLVAFSLFKYKNNSLYGNIDYVSFPILELISQSLKDGFSEISKSNHGMILLYSNFANSSSLNLIDEFKDLFYKMLIFYLSLRLVLTKRTSTFLVPAYLDILNDLEQKPLIVKLKNFFGKNRFCNNGQIFDIFNQD